MALLDIARRESADLVIVGSRGRGGFREMLLGGVGHHLTHHSPVPVVIVPSQRK
jgi:nucleotide-binding universal stress UspA family protein